MQGEYSIDKSLLTIDLKELYVETKPFSKGAYSKVYKAKYKDNKVCVKVISKTLAEDDPNFIEYVEREIALLKAVNHPNILEFYGAAEDDEDFYVVTEYVPGGNIRQYLQSKQDLSWDLKIHIAVGVAQGLGYLHAQNILHRDIKSENFLVGDAWQIKVCDLGFARKVESLGRKRSMSICGTEEYMSPEIMVGLDYNEKVDVFSYGIFLVELITLCYLPSDFKRTAATQFGIDILKLRDLVPADCPTQLMDLVLDCCSHSPHNRPDFEKVVTRLLDIQALLPHFSIPLPFSYEYFEEIDVTSQEVPPSRSRAVIEEIKLKEYWVDEAETEFPEYEEIEFKELTLEEANHVRIPKRGLTPVPVESQSSRERANYEEAPLTPLFHSISVPHEKHTLKKPDQQPPQPQQPPQRSADAETEEHIDDVDFLEMEEISLEVVNVVEIPEEEFAQVDPLDFDSSVITRNEKYSYYYN